MILMSLKIIPPRKRTAELIEALRVQMGRIQVQPGCIRCQLTQDTKEHNIVVYQEEWVAWPDVDKQILSERFSQILELMEQSVNTPELSFNDVRETRGIEYVQKLRNVAD
jgi:quinol monooxygenase YgiN